MADVNVTDLTQETYSTLDGTEQVIMFDSAEGKRATVAAVGEYVLKTLTTSLNGSTQTVANALSSLNSDLKDVTSTTLTDPTYGLTVKLRKVGILVFLSISGSLTNKNIPNGSWTSLVTIPSEYRPTVQPEYNTFIPQSGDLDPFLIRVQTSGVVGINPTASRDLDNGYLNISLVYSIV